jgi:hypothetical protein
MRDDCSKKGSPEGDTILWAAVALMFLSLSLNLFL